MTELYKEKYYNYTTLLLSFLSILLLFLFLPVLELRKVRTQWKAIEETFHEQDSKGGETDLGLEGDTIFCSRKMEELCTYFYAFVDDPISNRHEQGWHEIKSSTQRCFRHFH